MSNAQARQAQRCRAHETATLTQPDGFPCQQRTVAVLLRTKDKVGRAATKYSVTTAGQRGVLNAAATVIGMGGTNVLRQCVGKAEL